MSETAEILRKARALIEKPENWAQGDYALDAEGHTELPHNEGAVCFCAVGAIHKAAGVHISVRLPHVLSSLLTKGEFEVKRDYDDGDLENLITGFNDGHSHAEVLALFDRAIARAESEA